jgi:hypothetical protein
MRGEISYIAIGFSLFSQLNPEELAILLGHHTFLDMIKWILKYIIQRNFLLACVNVREIAINLLPVYLR